MRDAYGGTFMIEIMMVFVVLFVSFTAVIVNVAKTFRIKNELINIIEQDGGYNTKAESDISSYFDTTSYQLIGDRPSSCSDNKYWHDSKYCVTPLPDENNTEYYKVTVYVSISLPIFDLSFIIPVSGETEVHNMYQIK